MQHIKEEYWMQYSLYNILICKIKLRLIWKSTIFTHFSSGGGGISCADGLLGGVFSFSIIANGASGNGNGLTELVSIENLILTDFEDAVAQFPNIVSISLSITTDHYGFNENLPISVKLDF